MIPKFRVWHKDGKVMLSNYLGFMITDAGQLLIESMLGDETTMEKVELDNYIVMQYTGLKDKNGVEIYEGDVLFHPLQGRRKVYYPYSETVASYGLRDIDNGFGSTLQDSHAVWEIIGNVYENPELLKENTK